MWAPDLPDLDVTSLDGLLKAFRNYRPDVVIHGAAWTDVDGCEGDREKAFLENETGSRNVARASAALEARLVAVGTDFVFDGKKEGPYTEEDEPRPISVYGESKLAGEKAVLEEHPAAAIVRTAWLYGAGGTENFVRSILRAARAGTHLRVVRDERGSPTLTDDLAAAILSLVECRAEGVYHVVNGGEATRLEFARAILDIAGMKETGIEPIGSDRLGLPAARPGNSVLACERLAALGVTPPRHWWDALEDFLTRKDGGDV